MEWLCSGRAYGSLPPRPHHNSAGSRLTQKYALNFARSQIISTICARHVFSLFPTKPLPYLQPYLNLIQIEQINHKEEQMQRGNPFPQDRVEICEVVDKYFSHGIREIRLSLKPPPLNGLF